MVYTRDEIQTGLSRKAIFSQVEASLKRLGTDYIDVLYIHRWDYNTPIEETMSALNDLVRSGKVHYLGASACMLGSSKKRSMWLRKMVGQNFQSCKIITICFIVRTSEMIPFCKDSGVGLAPYSPLAAGRVVRDWDADTARSKTDETAKMKYDSTEEQDKAIVARVAEVAEKYGVTRAQVALAWLWQKGIDSPIVGVTKEKYLDDFMGAFDVTLTDDDMAYLDEKYLPHKSLVLCRVTFNLCFRFKAKGESDAHIEMDNLLKNPVKGRILSSETSINSWLADNGLIS